MWCPSYKRYEDPDEFYDHRCTSLDASTFSLVKKQVLEFLEDDECPSTFKLRFGEWFFVKIYMNYKARDDERDIACGSLQSAIENGKCLIQKAGYLRYRDVIAMSMIAQHFYDNRYPDDFVLQLLNDTQLIKNYLNYPRFSFEQMKEHFVAWINSTTDYQQKSNLLDVLLHNFKGDPRVDDIFQEMKFGGKQDGTLYDNEQNAHDEDIYKGTIGMCEKLLMDIRDNEKFQTVLEQASEPPSTPSTTFESMFKELFDELSDKQLDVVDGVFERCKIDITTFSGPLGTCFMVSDILFAIVFYIIDSPHKNVLRNVLLEEMESSVGFCTSGYLSHFINSLRGFDENYEVTVTFAKQLHSRISAAVNAAFQGVKDDDIIEGTYSGHHTPQFAKYARFVTNTVEKELPHIIRDYGIDDVHLNLANVLYRILSIHFTVERDGNTLRIEVVKCREK